MFAGDSCDWSVVKSAFCGLSRLKLIWHSGRQQTGYETLKLLECYRPLHFDIYLIRYRQGAYIPPHCDPVPEGRHYRINMTLKNAKQGGEFICDQVLWRWRRVVCFRSDISVHQVSRVEQGLRYVLSVGWVWHAI